MSRTSSRILSLWTALALVLALFAGTSLLANAAPVGLSAPDNLHWDGETGVAVWDSVPNAGTEINGHDSKYGWILFRMDTEAPPSLENPYFDEHMVSSLIIGGASYNGAVSKYNLAGNFNEEGYYYVAVRALGDGVDYADSPFALSDAFYYTAPSEKLKTPAGLKWSFREEDGYYYATCENLFTEDYISTDSFDAVCYDEAGEVIDWCTKTRAELEEKGLPGLPLIKPDGDLPDGNYYFTLQALSSRISQFLPSDVSGKSPAMRWNKEDGNTPGGDTSGSSDSDDSSGSGSGSGDGYDSAAASARTPSVQTSSRIGSLAAAAKSSGETVARSRGTGTVTVSGSAWTQLGELDFQHDTIANGAVQVRVTIHNPAALRQDLKVSGYVTGQSVKRVGDLFEKYFSNAPKVMHLDQAGAWGQEVRIAAKFDLTGMNRNNLVFYSYNQAANTYTQILNPRYLIDANGYVHFTTSLAGDILVSDGPLVRK
ncbi:MAG: hypothetical protein HFG26_11120 [Provencibacterium sp.]|jgi:hypothetical protein|nr:hypothetical protein [Provencibacterium sp.]